MITQESIERVLQEVDIVDVIGEFVHLKRAGTNYKGLCPFHNEKTPSFVVSPSKQIFKCFGCGESGSAVSFLMKHEHMSFAEAIKYLAQKYNIPIEETQDTEEEKEKQQKRDSLLIINKFANEFFKKNLWETDEGRSIGLGYIKERGFEDDIIKKFELGYAPDSYDAFASEALKMGFDADLMNELGLIIKKDNNRMFDRFYGRVIFPIHSISGQVVGFAGRILKKDDKAAKYVNSPESEIYHKRKLLYGMFFAKKSIIKKDKCYLVEGYTDVMALHQSGIENVVASSGTSLTEEQIRLIKRFTNNLTLIFDGDKAGIKAALRGIDMVLQEDLNVRVVLLPDGEDPDSFSKKMPPIELQEFIDTHEQDFISFKTEFLLSQTQNDPIERAKIITDIVKSISVIPDTVKQSTYVRQAAQIMDIKEEALYSEIKRILSKKFEKLSKKTRSRKEIEKTERQTPAVPSYVKQKAIPEEKELISYLLNFGAEKMEEVEIDGEKHTVTVADFIIRELQNDDLDFSNLGYRKIFELYKNQLAEHGKVDQNLFLHHPDDEIRKLAEEALSPDYEASKIWSRSGSQIITPDMNYKFAVRKAILTYKLKLVNSAYSQIVESMKDSDPTNFEAHLEKMAQLQQITQLRKEIIKELGNKRIIW